MRLTSASTASFVGSTASERAASCHGVSEHKRWRWLALPFGIGPRAARSRLGDQIDVRAQPREEIAFVPYVVVKDTEHCPAGRPWAVKTEGSGRVHGWHATKAEARLQQRALYVNVADAREHTAPKSKGVK